VGSVYAPPQQNVKEKDGAMLKRRLFKTPQILTNDAAQLLWIATILIHRRRPDGENAPRITGEYLVFGPAST
jgi:hypothetical protein